MAEERGFWNRAARRSGGDRPATLAAGAPETPEQASSRTEQWVIAGIQRRDPIAAIVGWVIATYEPDSAIAQQMRLTLGDDHRKHS